MTSPNQDRVEPDCVPRPQGTVAGVPYDWRRPTWARLRARWWNRDDPRVFTPKSFGWGFDVNLYRLVHPRRRGTAGDR
ncbi:hypothetical protein IU500_13610 [Nocardia terpenica]|uniref:DUF5808 domain-containing protein n=1 Tax=Nocardia terpenica TaxID=455432 RepID=UPI0018956698|nr:DUF5808 domain-containing protein [Nocardia terpenica]MBF6062785.1 hypothetical protein [Nocardia terpenica]MBF6105080.1 hypothetical protein [Nocardia terpenica]MBF6112483.1 hypothetical protein [Nocardia terpenica]MBF6118808.1 hypothetical protein [Nocardia terpenica]MBF6154277.1 hypothetical protein [Nocardia terpenica]